MLQGPYLLEEIACLIGASLAARKSKCIINGIMTLQDAKPGYISFLDNKRYFKYFLHTKASAVILRKEYLKHLPQSAIPLVVGDPYLAFAKVANLFSRSPEPVSGIHSTVIVAKGCHIHPSVSIAPYCVIGAGTCLQEGVIIDSGCVIGENVVIGSHSCLAARVTLYADTHIGEYVLIHSGSVIGSDGFGLAKEKGRWVKIPQLGKVYIGNHVEIGANVTIDRGALGDTYIDEGVQLDNQIQIGHNVHIGANTAIAGATAIAGSTYIGKNCMIGGGVCINGHIEIADDVSITGMSSVVQSIRNPGVYSSTQSVQPRQEWHKNSARFRQLDKAVRQLKKSNVFLSEKFEKVKK